MLKTKLIRFKKFGNILIFWANSRFRNIEFEDMGLEIEIFRKDKRNCFNPEQDNPCYLVKCKHTDVGLYF